MYPKLEVIEVYGISDKRFETEYLRSWLQLILSGFTLLIFLFCNYSLCK